MNDCECEELGFDCYECCFRKGTNDYLSFLRGEKTSEEFKCPYENQYQVDEWNRGSEFAREFSERK